MGMGLATACGPRVLRGICVPLFITVALAPLGGVARVTVCMARHLLFCERCGPDSAGHTRSWSRSPATAAGLGGPHDVRKGIVRRQATGSLGTGTRQAVRVGLGAARGIGRLFAGAVAGGFRVRPVSPLAEFMRMARHLLHGESRGLDSAGQAAE